MATNSLNIAKWYENYGALLFNYANARVPSREIAEDLVQETFLSGYKGRDSFKGNSSEKTWLVAILKRKIIDSFRRSSKVKEIKLLDNTDFFRKDGAWLADEAPLEWEFMENEDYNSSRVQLALQESIKKLSPLMAQVFTMKVIEGYSSEEVCEYLKLNPSHMWVVLHRARLRIRKYFEEKMVLADVD